MFRLGACLLLTASLIAQIAAADYYEYHDETVITYDGQALGYDENGR